MATGSGHTSDTRDLRIAHLEEMVDALTLEVEKLREEVRALTTSMRDSRVD